MKTLLAIVLMACPLQAGPQSHPLFDQMKKLEGHWVSDSKEHAADVTYKLSSGGSILVETASMANQAEMITIYHPDGESLALTHYCMLGNQPHMKAAKDQKPGSIRFEGDGGTNMKPEDKHMHSLTVTFVDADHLKQDWALFDGGKEQTVVTIVLTRKK
ncbi:MAG TPA: hypothetical protein VE981_00800 [Planctomycetota bacterium]|nr:hypothetical protein [Planctomycetota bacterium]